MEEIRKMSHEQLVQRVQKMIDQIQSCLEKAVA
jgi:carbon monoxide dehydrogenase subunit G